MTDPQDTRDEARRIAAAVAIASTVGRVLADEAGLIHMGRARGIDLAAMRRPGTLVWTDPMTGEVRYTPPGDRMYSTASMYAHQIIREDGQPAPLDWDSPGDAA